MLILLAAPPALLLPPSRLASGRSGRSIAMVVVDRADAQEEAYWRRWFWDQAEEAIDERFAKASKRDLKRVRDYISFNREAETLPKKLSKNPQYDVIGGFFPGLTVTPFHSAEGQPWETLEAAYPAIKQELEGLLAREQEFVDVGKPQGWRTMQIYYKGQLHPDFPAEAAPETMKLLSTLRLAGETAAFQRQSPRTGLPKHVDPCSWVLACHLGITIPDEGDGTETPYISVAGQKYHWSDGTVMIFDPSFKHETYNPTTQERVILNIDIFHPELTDIECEAIRLTVDLKKKLFGSTEEEEWRG